LKSVPGRSDSLDDVATRGWSVPREDIILPAAVLSRSALDHNRAWMKRFAEAAGVRLCPHGKTTMSPEIIRMQMEDGAWGITAATAAQVRIFRQWGVPRILLANQLVGQANLALVIDELKSDPAFELVCLVDSEEIVAILEEALAKDPIGRKLSVLIELGMPAGRTGLRSDADVRALARRLASSALLELRGLEAFEGIGRGIENGADGVGAFLTRLPRLARALVAEGLVPSLPLLSAGGSAFFDLAAEVLASNEHGEEPFEVVLRSGCYVVHDSDHYARLVDALDDRSALARSLGKGLRPALEIWAIVQSRPEPGTAIVGMGKRDCSFDAGMPRPLRWIRRGTDVPETLEGHCVNRLDDHHAYVALPDPSPLQVGDLVGFGISHPCTTFDRWPSLFVVDDELNVIGAVQTVF
jgi:D-serine dehydratase